MVKQPYPELDVGLIDRSGEQSFVVFDARTGNKSRP
jgi:hypothetical protein